MDSYLAFAAQYDPEGVAALIEENNAAILYRQALLKDGPGKTWASADFSHAAIARALKVDRSDPAAEYALAPFGLARVDGQPRILAAWPCPDLLSDGDIDWLGIETVIAWDPVNNTVAVMGDAPPRLVGAFASLHRGAIFGDPYAFFRSWIEDRAVFVTRWLAQKAAHWQTPPRERDAPGMLVIGNADKIAWRSSEMPSVIETVGIDPRALNRAVMKSANLPRITSRPSLMAAA